MITSIDFPNQELDSYRQLCMDLLLRNFDQKESLKLACHYLEDIAQYGEKGKINNDRVILDMDRLCGGEPIQYITGIAWFYGIPMRVEPSVLIPRPETEELVHWVYSVYKGSTPRLLDACTGSGCIANTLSRLLVGTRMDAFDISEEAIKIAKQNALEMKVEVNYFVLDIFEDFPLNIKYDAILSNPPYVSLDEKKLMDSSTIRFEPSIALFETKPLAFYNRLMDIGRQLLHQHGKLFVEINEFKADEMVAFATENHYTFEIRSDMQGKPRMMCLSPMDK